MKIKLPTSEIFKALSVETRIKILELLKANGPLGTKSIAKIIGVSVAAVSQHLKIMRLAGLVISKRDGYRIPYSIDEISLEYCRLALNKICSCGCSRTIPGWEEHMEHGVPESLEEYEQYLQKELKRVRACIKKAKNQKIR